MNANAYLAVSLALLLIGATGVLIRRNVVTILMCIELMLNAANLNLATFARVQGTAHGQVLALMIVLIAVAEVVVGLALLMALFRTRGTIQADEIDLLRW